jgi:hypothetical protein
VDSMNMVDSHSTPATDERPGPCNPASAAGEASRGSSDAIAHLAELEEKVCRLQYLVCHLLAKNERMRQQLRACGPEAVIARWS